MEQRAWWRLGKVPRLVASLAVAALVASGLSVAGPQAPARADSAPADPATPATVAADGLPTVQIDGVAWSQVVVGGTVYVAGQFTTARPAGAAAGVSTVTRSNLLAYDLVTGALIDAWKPVLDGPAYVITASLDGTRLYVGGDFTHVNGAVQNRIVVLDRATGLRVSGFTVGANAAVRAITSTPSTIYLGGNFNTVGGVTHYRLAALSATTGALLSWKATAQSAQVEALVLSPDNSRLIVGGRFTTLNNVAAPGSGAVSTSTGATLAWAANAIIKDWGYAAGIMSLVTDGNLIYGSGFAFIKDANSAGNLEGVFSADPMTGAIVWVEDCHGDTYSVFANPGGTSVYSVGHVHYCGNIGAYPEGAYRYGLAFAKTTAMTITPNTVANYYDWQGYRAPAQLDYYPDMTKGTFTGQGQAAWNVTGTSQYVVYGGEFLTVNGQPQQGLVRMAVAAKSLNKLGPQLSGGALQPAAVSKAAGTAQVSWPTNWDKDNETLTYKVFRDTSTTPVYTTTGMATSWQLSRLSFTDTGLVNGSVHSYKVVEVDPFGNSVTSPSVSVTVASTGTQGAYAAKVMAANPLAYWRLGEASGSAQDWTGFADESVGAGVTRAVAGALSGDTNAAARFTGSSSSRLYSTKSAVGLNRFSIEAWFSTTSTAGGKIVGFGDSATATNSSNVDRQVYMGADGRLSFGVNPNVIRVVTTPIAYNDGQWHHVVATLGATGMDLYVDGAVRATLADTVSGKVFTGYWHLGGDSVAGWPNAAGENFAGDLDDVAIYGRALPAAEVAAHQSTGTGGVFPNLQPTASFTATGGVLTASVNASGSSDPDGTIASYAWKFGDTTTGTGVSATHTYAAAGTYTITLNVTDNRGGTSTTTRQVVVSPPNQPPVASFTATPADLTVAVDASASTDPDGTIASYAWTYGDGGTGTGVTASHTYPAGGTYTVTLTVTDNSGAPTTTNRQVLVNAPPTASFTATGGELTTSVDATASTDPDGTIASYAWDFGDLTTGTGVSATHAYATGGTYTLTLTVTDNQGATATTSRLVLVTNPNQPPVASFQATTWGMSATVDAAASTDADGTITSYAWDFGDGATGTGVSVSHVYATPGAYLIKLTVADNTGATGTTTQTATFDPASAGFLAADTFDRTVADGFAVADLGGPWTATAGATSVLDGAGQLTLAAASSTAGARLPGVTAIDLTTQVTESWDKRPGGSGGWFTVRGRITTGGEYRLKVGHQASGAVTARFVRTTAAGVETAITAEVTVPGVTYTAGTPIVALFQVTGTNPTTVRAKVWAANQAQPSAWFIDTTDTTAALQVAGHTGVAASLSSTTTNGPVTVRLDNYSVTIPS